MGDFLQWRSSHLALLFTRLPRSFHSLAMTRVFTLLSPLVIPAKAGIGSFKLKYYALPNGGLLARFTRTV